MYASRAVAFLLATLAASPAPSQQPDPEDQNAPVVLRLEEESEGAPARAGLGRVAIDSIFARDYPVAMAIVVLFTLFFILINLAVDFAYTIIDPRIRARMVGR